MKRFYIPLMSLFLLIACNQAPKKTTPIEFDEITSSASKTFMIQEHTPEFNELYSQLMTLKDSETFKRYGFGNGGPHDGWLKVIDAHVDNPKPNWSLTDKVAISELRVVAMEYVASKGEETEHTQWFKYEYYPKKAEFVSDASSPYITEGTWALYLVGTQKGESYVHDITVRKTDQGWTIEEKGKQQLMKQTVDGYWVSPNNSNGEFYRFDKDLNLNSFDNHGQLNPEYVKLKRQ